MRSSTRRTGRGSQFLFEQPLLQNFGVEINQLSDDPAEQPARPRPAPAGGTRTEGILITRLRFDQQRAEFERNVNILLLNVEYAYWNLYGAYSRCTAASRGCGYAWSVVQVNKTGSTPAGSRSRTSSRRAASTNCSAPSG